MISLNLAVLINLVPAIAGTPQTQV